MSVRQGRYTGKTSEKAIERAMLKLANSQYKAKEEPGYSYRKGKVYSYRICHIKFKEKAKLKL